MRGSLGRDGYGQRYLTIDTARNSKLYERLWRMQVEPLETTSDTSERR